MPAGLRSQTPMNQTASKPNLAMASHSAAGTQLKSTGVPVFRLSSESQTQVLISYSVGYRGQTDMLVASFGLSLAFATAICRPYKMHISSGISKLTPELSKLAGNRVVGGSSWLIPLRSD